MSAEVALAAALVLVWLGGFFLGVFALLAYIISRMMRNDDWDDSNITNALRLLSHVTLHPEDFGKMYYVTDDQFYALTEYMPNTMTAIHKQRPFWYVSKDELSEVVETRP